MRITHQETCSDRLIIFFNGFSLSEDLYEHLNKNTYDIMFVSDYRYIDTEYRFSGLTKKYTEINLVGYSLGVFVAASLPEIHKIRFNNCVAINGTLQPVDDHFGIPEKIFKGTIHNMNEKNLIKFYQRVFSEDYELLKDKLNVEPLKAKAELLNINEYISQNLLVENIYTKAIISRSDKIFPPTHQLNFWQDAVKTVIISGGHFPFMKFYSWDDLLSA